MGAIPVVAAWKVASVIPFARAWVCIWPMNCSKGLGGGAAMGMTALGPDGAGVAVAGGDAWGAGRVGVTAQATASRSPARAASLWRRGTANRAMP
jgi:hypothetical protein